MSTIPSSSLDVSPEWLTSQLSADLEVEPKGIRVLDLEVDASGKHGFLSSVFRAKCEIEGREVRLFGKLSPVGSEYQTILNVTCSHVTEVQCFKYLFKRLRQFEGQMVQQESQIEKYTPRLDEFLPKFYCGEYVAQSAAYFLIMEDLGSEFSMASFNGGLTETQVKSALSCLGYFHALGFAFLNSLKGSVETELPYLNVFFKGDQALLDMFDEKRDKIMADFEKEEGGDLLKAKVAKLRDELSIGQKRGDVDQNKFLIHGDMWANNILFNSGNKCKILDWQFATEGSIFLDIGTLALISMSPEDTVQHMNEFMEAYYEGFVSFSTPSGIEPPWSRERFLSVAAKKAAREACIWCLLSFDLIANHPNFRERILWLLRDMIES